MTELLVTLTGRNRTGPPCSVGRLTTHAPAGPPAALQTTPTNNRRQQAKQYWPIRRASNNPDQALSLCMQRIVHTKRYDILLIFFQYRLTNRHKCKLWYLYNKFHSNRIRQHAHKVMKPCSNFITLHTSRRSKKVSRWFDLTVV